MLLHSESGDKPLYLAADREFDRHIRHRSKELTKIVAKLEMSLSKPRTSSQDRSFCRQHRLLVENKDRINSLLVREEYGEAPMSLIAEYEDLRNGGSHLDAMRLLAPEASRIGSEFLRGIAARPYLEMRALFALRD